MPTPKSAKLVKLTRSQFAASGRIGFDTEQIAVPVSRIAQLKPYGSEKAFDNQPATVVELRQPESMVWVVETIDQIVKLVNELV